MSALRLKEQDDLVNLIRRLCKDPTGVQGAFAHVQELLQEHQLTPATSRLRTLCPSIRGVFLKLDLVRALEEFEQQECVHLSRRKYVAPTFSEVRSVLNLSVVHAVAPKLTLLTLDADDTLYNDGGSLSFDAPNIPWLIRLLRAGVRVAVVTAAAYPKEPHRYENRLAGLLSAIAFAVEAGAPAQPLLDNFYIMGGQCNYLLRPRCTTSPMVRVYLEEVPGAEWKPHRGVRWEQASVKATLDVAEAALRDTAASLLISPSTLLIRKERAVGVISSDPINAPLSYEVLEELTLATQAALEAHALANPSHSVPTCAFNGGHDVFVDIGSKSLGISALQGLIGAEPEGTVHVGDRFTSTGNDLRARDVSNSLWVSGPHDTVTLLSTLVPLVLAAKAEGAAAASLSFPTTTTTTTPTPTSNNTASIPAAAAASNPLHPDDLAAAASGGGGSTSTSTTTSSLGAHVRPPPLTNPSSPASSSSSTHHSLHSPHSSYESFGVASALHLDEQGVLLPPSSLTLTLRPFHSSSSSHSLLGMGGGAPSSPRHRKPSDDAASAGGGGGGGLGGVGVEASFGGGVEDKGTTERAIAAASKSLWMAVGGHVVQGSGGSE